MKTYQEAGIELLEGFIKLKKATEELDVVIQKITSESSSCMKEKTISGEDKCICGHDREWHNKEGCHSNKDYGVSCDCTQFKSSTKSENKK